MKRVLACVVAFLCLFSIVASSQKKDVKGNPCERSETQADANACARREHQNADAEMNKVYDQLMPELAGYDGKHQEQLQQAQALWIKYRDANCESEASIYEGGSIRPAVYNWCLATVTQERTRRLKAFLAELQR